jgi:acylphosphatase
MFRETDLRPKQQRQPERRTLCYNFVAFVSDAKQAKRYLVSGRVQGVGFRYFTQAAAEKLRIGGFVRNLRDGRVEVFALGTPQQHQELRAMLERGPRFSSVSEVLEEPATPDRQYENDFFVDSSD